MVTCSFVLEEKIANKIKPNETITITMTGHTIFDVKFYYRRKLGNGLIEVFGRGRYV